MRIKFTLRGPENFFIPFNYTHSLASIVYNLFEDRDFANSLHDSKITKYFTFSNLEFNNYSLKGNGFRVDDGYMSFWVSSPSFDLLKQLFLGAFHKEKVFFNNTCCVIDNIEWIENPSFKNKIVVRTLSPVLIRIRNEEGRIVDINPTESLFFDKIASRILIKYCNFNEIDESDLFIQCRQAHGRIKSKRISIKNGANRTFNRAFMMNMVLKGDNDLVDFAYDNGIGDKNSMGFGMIEAV